MWKGTWVIYVCVERGLCAWGEDISILYFFLKRNVFCEMVFMCCLHLCWYLCICVCFFVILFRFCALQNLLTCMLLFGSYVRKMCFKFRERWTFCVIYIIGGVVKWSFGSRFFVWCLMCFSLMMTKGLWFLLLCLLSWDLESFVLEFKVQLLFGVHRLI